jgi:uncharacterized protein (DUF433 family)
MAVANTTQIGIIIPDPGLLSGTEPLITKTPGVCGGRACIAGRRIPVWSLVEYRNLGATDEKILEAYPQLSLQHLRAAWVYANANAAEISGDISENDSE